jgi:hypothetical protein
VAAEIQFARLRVLGTVHRPRMPDPGKLLARYTDGEGRPLKQRARTFTI